jgi:imidazolonepropionase-like amidohydrolase
MLLRVADEFGFKIRTLQHVLEGYKVAKEIAAHGAGASTFSDWWSYKVEAYDAIPYNAALMHKKGVLVSLNSDSAELMRHLNTEAAKVVKYGGVTEEEALAMVTINPAKQLGIDNRVGSIEAGKDADLVLYDKNPLSNYAKVQRVWIDGQQYFDRDKDVSERAAKEARKKSLIEKERQTQQQGSPMQKKDGGVRRSAAGGPETTW